MAEDLQGNSVPFWSNVQNYNNQLAKLWDDVRLARKSINDVGGQNGYRALEDWLECQKMVLAYLSYYIDEEAVKEIKKSHKQISEMTFNIQFSSLGTRISPEQWGKIKQILSDNEDILCWQQGKNNLFMHMKYKEDPEMYQS